MDDSGQLPVGALVLGASGYVAGELLRWIAGHPGMRLAGAVSASHAGLPIASPSPTSRPAFRRRPSSHRATCPQCLPPQPGNTPASPRSPPLPTGVGAAGGRAARCRRGGRLRSAGGGPVGRFPPLRPGPLPGDLRSPHPEPDLLAEFTCGLPELAGIDTGGGPGRVAHPGCFATAVALAAAPLRRAGLVEPELHVSAVTGSTGSGGMPKETTHHPLRHANLFAYKPLGHRHAPEMEDLLAVPGERPARVRFVPTPARSRAASTPRSSRGAGRR